MLEIDQLIYVVRMIITVVYTKPVKIMNSIHVMVENLTLSS